MRASILIPTRGRAELLSDALASLLECGLEREDAEVVVVDNNDDDAQSAAVRRLCESAGGAVRYAAEPSPGQSAARHRGAREARGEVLLYLDDDVRVGSRWLAAILEAFESPDTAIAGGPSLPAFRASVPAWLWGFLQPTPYGGWSCGWLSLLDPGRRVDGIDPIWIWGLNFAIRAERLRAFGGFHPDLVPAAMQRWQGDGETGLSLSARASGATSVHVPDAIVFHSVDADRMSVGYFRRRAYYQGVCDSYTAIRAGADPQADAPDPRVPPTGTERWGTDAVRRETTAAYNAGWQFHQRETAADPRLLAWVRRPDYWDADIRDEIAAARTAPRADTAP